MSIGGDIVDEFYEKNIIPEYQDLLRACLNALEEISDRRLNTIIYRDTKELKAAIKEKLKGLDHYKPNT